MMETGNTSIYGRGFKAASAALYGRRLDQLLNYVRHFGKLPSGAQPGGGLPAAAGGLDLDID